MMKTTKCILCVLLAMVLTVALCACGGNADNNAGGETTTTTQGTTTTTNADGGNLDGENNYNDGMFGAW